MNIEKEYKQLKEAAKLAADASFKLSEQVYNLKAENKRLKFVISEIKEIAEIIYNTNCNYIIESGKILNLIKKVEDISDK